MRNRQRYSTHHTSHENVASSTRLLDDYWAPRILVERGASALALPLEAGGAVTMKNHGVLLTCIIFETQDRTAEMPYLRPLLLEHRRCHGNIVP